MHDMQLRLERIAEAHQKYVDEKGGTLGYCGECDWTWPCPTYRWATDAVVDPLGTWNPDDDLDEEEP